MPRPLTPGFTAALVLLLATGAAAAPAPRPERCDACLRAGAASVPLEIPPGTPLAGYGARARRLLVPDVFGRYPHAFWFKPHTGELERLAARAVALEAGGARVVWIAIDLIAVDRGFTGAVTRDLERALGAPATVIISASHTHSGPGAFIDSGLMGFVAVDRQDAVVRDAFVHASVEAARRAATSLTAARLGAVSVEGPPVTRGRLGQPPDRELIVMKVVSRTGAPVALVWNYAIHGTMLGPKNLSVSGDVMGIASRRLEESLGVPALFVNGTVGDVSPELHGGEAAVAVGAELATAVRAAWDRIDRVADARVAVRTARVALPSPSLSIRNCTGRFVPRWLRVPLGRVWPSDATLTALTIGDVAIVAMPGELQSALGRGVKNEARRRWRYAAVAGVSNDYLGYFVAAADYDRVSYVTCASVYGASAGERLVTAATDLLRTLGETQR